MPGRARTTSGRRSPVRSAWHRWPSRPAPRLGERRAAPLPGRSPGRGAPGPRDRRTPVSGGCVGGMGSRGLHGVVMRAVWAVVGGGQEREVRGDGIVVWAEAVAGGVLGV